MIELLVVMAIIAILASLIIYAGIGVINKGKRSRAASEISAMSTALEGYKTDNGIYPANNPALGNAGVSTSLVTNSAASPYVSASKDGTGTDYQQNSQIVYLALSGQTNFNDAAVGAKSYMSFTRSQVGDLATGSYVKDPWGSSYGYFPGSVTSGGAITNVPYNGTGFFDLWSTAGLTAPKATNSAAWISNWQ